MAIKLEDLHKSLEVGLEERMEAPGEGDMTQIEPASPTTKLLRKYRSNSSNVTTFGAEMAR